MTGLGEAYFPYGKNFYIVQFSAILNSTALRSIHLALAWWILSITNDPKVFAIFVGVGTASDILARGLFGSLGDTYNKQRLISICYWMSLISTLIIAILSTKNLYIPVLLILCQAMSGLSIGIREPLQNSIVPSLVRKEQLSNAIQWRTAAMTIVSFCSPVVGTGLITIIGAQNTICFGVALTLSSLILLGFYKIEASINREKNTARPKWYSGFSTIIRLPPEISLIKITFFMNLGLFPFLGVVLPAFFYQNYSKSPWLFGLADVFFSFGMFIGAAKINPLINLKLGRVKATYWGYLALGFGILLTAVMCQILTTFNLSFFILLCLGMCLAGSGLTVAVTNTSFMRSAASPNTYLNRISASSTFSTGIASPLGVFVSGLLLNYFGLYPTLMILSVILVLASLSSFLSVDLRKVLSLPDEEIHGAYSRFYPKAFLKGIKESVD